MRHRQVSCSFVLASLPVDVNLLGEGDSSVVVRDLAKRGRVAAGESNTVVDIEEAASTARRPDDSRRGHCELIYVSAIYSEDKL